MMCTARTRNSRLKGFAPSFIRNSNWHSFSEGKTFEWYFAESIVTLMITWSSNCILYLSERPSPKGEGFRLRLKSLFPAEAGRSFLLKQAQGEGSPLAGGAPSASTRKSSSRSWFWFSMYALITSSVTLPELQQKYPRAQRCCPQNFFLSIGNSWNSRYDVFPFSLWSSLLMVSWGGMDRNRWIWSLDTCPFIIATSCCMQSSRTMSRTRRAISPTREGRRYFTIHTICRWIANCVCAPLR